MYNYQRELSFRPHQGDYFLTVPRYFGIRCMVRHKVSVPIRRLFFLPDGEEKLLYITDTYYWFPPPLGDYFFNPAVYRQNE